MRLRCLVVSYASPFRRTPFFVCATLSLALWLVQGPRAFAQGAFSLTSASFRAGAQSILRKFSIRATARAVTAPRN